MADRRVVVLEANEIPPQVFRWYAQLNPHSVIARLVRTGALHETVNADELGGRDLYPSQTWATLGTGVSYAEHGVYWYGDPKPAAAPFYWQLAAAAGKRVGVVGTLHSSPLEVQCADPNIVFAIPDCFAVDADTKPERYRKLQELNLHMTRANGRTSSGRPRSADARTMATSPRLGVRPSTIAWLARLMAEVGAGKVSRERLRCAQFALFADVFLRLCKEQDPDLAVVFTNHVASNMHRYWYASFPGDWDRPHYDDAWVERYRDEIPHAMRLLDRVLAALVTFCDRTDRDLFVVSSMGMVAEPALDTTERRTVTARDPGAFVRAMGFVGRHVVKTAMVPQIQVEFETDAAAQAAFEHARAVASSARGLHLGTAVAGNVVTLSYTVEPTALSIDLDGRTYALAVAGLEVHAIDDHRSGTHHPVGSLIDAHGSGEPRRFDVREVAPMILERCGVARPAHLRPLAGVRS
jgi:hypothetical protein